MSMRRKRRGTQAGEFQDPMKNYDPPSYDDELEQSLGEDEVRSMQTQPFTAVDVSTTIHETLKLMAERDIACVMITEGDQLAGIFSERDVLNKVANQFDRIKDHAITEVMTAKPLSVYETDCPAKPLNLMAVSGFRHVPILDLDERVVGVLGPRRVTEYLQRYFRQHERTESPD